MLNNFVILLWVTNSQQNPTFFVWLLYWSCDFYVISCDSVMDPTTHIGYILTNYLQALYHHSMCIEVLISHVIFLCFWLLWLYVVRRWESPVVICYLFVKMRSFYSINLMCNSIKVSFQLFMLMMPFRW